MSTLFTIVTTLTLLIFNCISLCPGCNCRPRILSGTPYPIKIYQWDLGGYYHSAVKVFGMYYEYGTTVRGRASDPEPREGFEPYNDLSESHVQCSGTTSVTHDAFTTWFAEEKVNWTRANYNLVNRNCHHFAEKLRDFFELECCQIPWVPTLVMIA